MVRGLEGCSYTNSEPASQRKQYVNLFCTCSSIVSLTTSCIIFVVCDKEIFMPITVAVNISLKCSAVQKEGKGREGKEVGGVV